MSEPDRVLRPLDEAAPSIEMLETYKSPAALLEALRATWHGVELTLRRLLRSDATAPDAIRMTALSAAQMPVGTVLLELRRRELISLRLAGRVHELTQAIARAPDVRAADADVALDVARSLRAEVEARHAGVAPSDAPPAGRGEASGPPATEAPARGPRRPLYLMLATVLAVIAIIIAVAVFAGDSAMERGVSAFEDGRHDVAEQYFRAAVQRDDGNVTARLYLARIMRSQGRTREAADLLSTAARLSPRDAAVRRELGYLFLELEREAAAIEQFETAVELEPDEPLNWVALVRSLQRMGSPAADEWLGRAPAAARALLGTRGQ